MTDRPTDDDIHKPLLSDDELVALMDGKYRKEAPPADQVGMERNWQALGKKASIPRRARRQGLVMVFGAVAVAAAAAFVIIRAPKEDDLGVKGGGQGWSMDGLALAWQHDEGREAVKDGGQVIAGRGKLVVTVDKAKLPAGVEAAAVLVGPEDAPQPASMTNVELTATQVELPIFPAAGRYKVCVAEAENAVALKTKTDVMSGMWDAVTGANCVRLTAKAGQ